MATFPLLDILTLKNFCWLNARKGELITGPVVELGQLKSLKLEVEGCCGMMGLSHLLSTASNLTHLTLDTRHRWPRILSLGPVTGCKLERLEELRLEGKYHFNEIISWLARKTPLLHTITVEGWAWELILNLSNLANLKHLVFVLPRYFNQVDILGILNFKLSL